MSYMITTCPWCGTTYDFGIVGTQQIGTGHTRCEGLKQCSREGCEEAGRFLVVDLFTPAHWQKRDYSDGKFVCQKHIGRSGILSCQPVPVES